MTEPTQLPTGAAEAERKRERVVEFLNLSPDDCGYIVAVLLANFPEVFDATVAELGRRPSGLEEVTH